MITAPPAQPPAIEQPASYQLSYGVVTGLAAPGTRRVLVRVGRRTLADRPLRGRRFHLSVSLPLRESTVAVVTVDAQGRRATARVTHVLGAPRAATPRVRVARVDVRLARELRRLVAGFGGTAGIYVQNLATGAGAAWNARATFPAASTLKLGIAVAALARSPETPSRGSALDGLLRRMLILSDNAAANETERWYGGSTSGGSAVVNALMRSLGLVDSEMYGGYELNELGDPSRTVAAAIPLRVESQPGWGRGKKTTAYDLASLLRAVWLASAGRGPLRTHQPGFTVADARYLLYVLAQAHDEGKLGRIVGRRPGVLVIHKAGWINVARHDNGIVVWPGGAILATVMTYRPAGAGVGSDELAGRVAAAALRRPAG